MELSLCLGAHEQGRQISDHSTKWSVMKLKCAVLLTLKVASVACLSLFLLELAIIAYACTAKNDYFNQSHDIFRLNMTFSVFYLIEISHVIILPGQFVTERWSL